MSVLALPTYRQRPVSAPSMNYESPITRSDSGSPDELQASLQPLLNREALLAAWPKRCALVVEEIIVTEKNYVESLHEVVMGYLKPLYGFLLSVAEGPNFIETVFSNIMRLQQINMELFNNFLQHYSSPRDFGNVFVDFVSHFLQYTDYCVNFPHSEEVLQKTLKNDPETREFIMDCQLQIGHALPLITYLHKPVQRILKYRLLLEEILKGYPQDLDGHQELKCALETMCRVAQEINEKTRQMENRKRVENIQKSVKVKHKQWSRSDLSSYGNLITEESCKVLGRKGGERQLLLFEKTVLFLSKKGADQYKYKAHIMVEELDLSEVTNSPTAFKIFSHYSTSKQFTVQVRNQKVKEDLICKFRSILESQLEKENSNFQQDEDKKEEDLESSSLEGSASLGDSEGSLNETRMVVRQRTLAFKSKDVQWRKRQQTSTRKLAERRSTLPAMTVSEGEEEEAAKNLLIGQIPISLSEGMIPDTLADEGEDDDTTSQEEKGNPSRKGEEDDRPRPSKAIKLQRRAAVRYKRESKSAGRAMTFSESAIGRRGTHKQMSLDLLAGGSDEVSSLNSSESAGDSAGEREGVFEISSGGILQAQSSLDRGVRPRYGTSRLVRQPHATEIPSNHSLSEEDTETTPAIKLISKKRFDSSWLCPVMEEAPSMDIEDDEDEGEDEAQDDDLVVGSSLRSDLRLKWNQDRLEQLRNGDMSSFITLPRKRKGDETAVEQEAKGTKPASPTLVEDKGSSKLPARGTVFNRIAMYENLSKMCADNQATYNSIPQLKNRRPFSMKVGGQAVPNALLQRTKRTSMAHTVYTSKPTQTLAAESKAASLTPPQQTTALVPVPAKDDRELGYTKPAYQTGTVCGSDVPSPQSCGAESMQYDSGVASGLNSPVGAPSSPPIQQHTPSSPTTGLTKTVEHTKTSPTFDTKKKEQSHGSEKSSLDQTTTPTLQMPGLSVTVQLVRADLPQDKEETCRKLSFGVDDVEMAGQDPPLQTVPTDTVPSSTTALPGNGAIASKPGADDSAEVNAPYKQEPVTSDKHMPSAIETTIGHSGLRERKPKSHLATTAEEAPSVHTQPAASSSSGVQPQRSFLSASFTSQGAQIGLNLAFTISVVSLPYPYHTVLMGLLILAVCIFFFVVTLPYHTFGKNFPAN